MQTTELSIMEAPNYYVTEHFMYSDFICNCCDTLRIIPAFYRHVSLLERMRIDTGIPIEITSGYRCKDHNAKSGGAKRSWHLLFATDIKPADGDHEKLALLYKHALELGFGGIGRYDTFIHLDLRPETIHWRV